VAAVTTFVPDLERPSEILEIPPLDNPSAQVKNLLVGC
jgi:hypothetical protein